MMLPVLLTNLILFVPAASTPEAPPPRPKPKLIQITTSGGTVITVPHDMGWECLVAKTPDGPRVRLRAGDIIIDATQLRITGLEALKGRTLELRLTERGELIEQGVVEPDLQPPARPKPAQP